jgi:hypothetical protein
MFTIQPGFDAHQRSFVYMKERDVGPSFDLARHSANDTPQKFLAKGPGFSAQSV